MDTGGIDWSVSLPHTHTHTLALSQCYLNRAFLAQKQSIQKKRKKRHVIRLALAATDHYSSALLCCLAIVVAPRISHCCRRRRRPTVPRFLLVVDPRRTKGQRMRTTQAPRSVRVPHPPSNHFPVPQFTDAQQYRLLGAVPSIQFPHADMHAMQWHPCTAIFPPFSNSTHTQAL